MVEAVHIAVGFIWYLWELWASRGGRKRIVWFGARRDMAGWTGPWNNMGVSKDVPL